MKSRYYLTEDFQDVLDSKFTHINTFTDDTYYFLNKDYLYVNYTRDPEGKGYIPGNLVFCTGKGTGNKRKIDLFVEPAHKAVDFLEALGHTLDRTVTTHHKLYRYIKPNTNTWYWVNVDFVDDLGTFLVLDQEVHIQETRDLFSITPEQTQELAGIGYLDLWHEVEDEES